MGWDFLMALAESYSDDCKYRNKDNKIVCRTFHMSCAMFHTMMIATKYSKEHANVCPFYEQGIISK
jgi:hypothetical protein